MSVVDSKLTLVPVTALVMEPPETEAIVSSRVWAPELMTARRAPSENKAARLPPPDIASESRASGVDVAP